MCFFCGFCVLFIKPGSTDFSKFFFKIRSHGIIHTFKNYFVAVFSVFSNKWYPNNPLVVQMLNPFRNIYMEILYYNYLVVVFDCSFSTKKTTFAS